MVAWFSGHLDMLQFGMSPSDVRMFFPGSLQDRRSRSPGPCCGMWPHSHRALNHRHQRGAGERSIEKNHMFCYIIEITPPPKKHP